MCGIIAIVRRRATRTTPTSDEIRALLPALVQALPSEAEALDQLAVQFELLNVALGGVPGVTCLLSDPNLVATLVHNTDILDAEVAAVEKRLAEPNQAVDLEAVNAALLRLKDAVWSVSRDRLRTARAVEELCDGATTLGAVEAFTSIQEALSALDRLEVRGRDSAGLHLLVRDHALDVDEPSVHDEIATRSADPNFASGSVRVANGHLSFVYKAAAEIGELGDNTRVIRAAIQGDDASGVVQRFGKRHGSWAHALGERRHCVRTQRASAQLRHRFGARMSVRDRSAKR